jgi:hypothetical protein
MLVGDRKGNGEARIDFVIGRGGTISEHEVVEAVLIGM